MPSKAAHVSCPSKRMGVGMTRSHGWYKITHTYAYLLMLTLIPSNENNVVCFGGIEGDESRTKK